MNVTLFRGAIWNQVIRNDFQQYNNLPVKREAFIQQMVCDMLAHERYTYPLKATDDFETISALENSGIIIPYQENRKNWMMSHDVYEEIVTNHIFTERLEQDTYPEKTFFADLGNSLRSRKSYRIWLESRLSDGDERILEFLLGLFDDEELEQQWKDETLIALMNSESEEGAGSRNVRPTGTSGTLRAGPSFLTGGMTRPSLITPIGPSGRDRSTPCVFGLRNTGWTVFAAIWRCWFPSNFGRRRHGGCGR